MNEEKKQSKYVFRFILVLTGVIGIMLLFVPANSLLTNRIMRVGLTLVLPSTVLSFIYLNRDTRKFNLSYLMMVFGYLLFCISDTITSTNSRTMAFFIFPIFLILKTTIYISRMCKKKNTQAKRYVIILLIIFAVQTVGTAYGYGENKVTMIQMTGFIILCGAAITFGQYLAVRKFIGNDKENLETEKTI